MLYHFSRILPIVLVFAVLPRSHAQESYRIDQDPRDKLRADLHESKVFKESKERLELKRNEVKQRLDGELSERVQGHWEKAQQSKHLYVSQMRNPHYLKYVEASNLVTSLKIRVSDLDEEIAQVDRRLTYLEGRINEARSGGQTRGRSGLTGSQANSHDRSKAAIKDNFYARAAASSQASAGVEMIGQAEASDLVRRKRDEVGEALMREEKKFKVTGVSSKTRDGLIYVAQELDGVLERLKARNVSLQVEFDRIKNSLLFNYGVEFPELDVSNELRSRVSAVSSGRKGAVTGGVKANKGFVTPESAKALSLGGGAIVLLGSVMRKIQLEGEIAAEREKDGRTGTAQ